MMQTLMDWTLHIYLTLNSVFVNVQRWKKKTFAQRSWAKMSATLRRLHLESLSSLQVEVLFVQSPTSHASLELCGWLLIL